MSEIKKFTFDLTERVQRDFIHEQGLDNEYEAYLGKIALKIGSGEISLDEYSKGVSRKILKG